MTPCPPALRRAGHTARPFGQSGRSIAAALALLLASVAALPAQTSATPERPAPQMPARLVADSVTLDGDMLTARGHVTAFVQGTRLEARALRYDGATDRLEITGPILVTQPDGTLLTARAAQLDPQLEAGLLMGARLVLDRRLQLAAARAARAGPITQLGGVAATSCNVCAGRPPLWEIRAARVTHDAQARQLWFEGAEFRLRGTPLLWLPNLRMPDPTARRARGVLLPRITSSSTLGPGLKLPYFLPLGDHRDLTVSPWLSRDARAVELRYRQAFQNGDIDATLMAARDDLRDGLRGALTGTARFMLPGRVRMDADLELISDDDVPYDYDLEDDDRLDSALSFTRITARSLSRARVTGYHTLRDGEDNNTITALTFDARHGAHTPWAGGMLHWQIDADGYARRSDLPGAGRDGLRAGAELKAERQWITGPGLVLDGSAMLRLDTFFLDQEDPSDEAGQRLQGAALAGLSWPLRRQTARATHVITPRATLVWAGTRGITPPNEDSRRVALDEANLHAIARAPGEDLAEPGTRLSIGADWTMHTARGTTTQLYAGRLFQTEPEPAFSASSGLRGRGSDWLMGARIDLAAGFAFEGRALFDDDARINRSESRILWDGAQAGLSASHLFLSADAAEGRPQDISEWEVEAGWDTRAGWAFTGDVSYDAVRHEPVRAGLGAVWRNECVRIDISASRRFSTLGNVSPTTSLSLDIALEGFSAATPGLRQARSCRP